MTVETVEERLVTYLADVHSIEQQALAQMRRASGLLGDELASIFEQHLAETEVQEQRVRERLEAHGASPSKLKDVAGSLGGLGMVLFAKSQPDTPGKLFAHAFSYEHMEVAAYELLERVARRAGDGTTATMAAAIAAEEWAMAQRLAERFDLAVEASLKATGSEPAEVLNTYLADAHAIEEQSRKLLQKGRGIAGAPELSAAFQHHLLETEEQLKRLERLLEARGSSPSAAKDAALKLGALNWGAFMAAQPDTPPKLAGFAFAVEHLEIGSYELLRRVAVLAGDEETAAAVDATLSEERRAAERISEQWDAALDAAS